MNFEVNVRSSPQKEVVVGGKQAEFVEVEGAAMAGKNVHVI